MKKIIIGLLIVVMVLAVAISLKAKLSKKSEIAEIIPTPTVILPTISDDIIVELNPKSGNQAVSLKISGIPPDLESIEYELTYIAEGGLPRGVLGKITLSGETEVLRDDLVLGTCSSGKCVYDKGVTSIDLTLKFNSPTGASVFQKTYPL